MIRRAAVHGALIWVTFGLVEHLLMAVLPAWRETSLLFVPAGRVTVWLFTVSIYAVLGGLAGAIGGVALSLAARAGVRWPADRERVAADAATLTLVAAWLVHVADTRWLSRSVYLAIAVGLVVLAALAARLFSRREATVAATAWLISPVGNALCLLAPLVFRNELHITWMTERVGSSASSLKMGVSAAGMALVVLFLVGGAWQASRHGRAIRPNWARRALGVAVLLLVTLASGSWLDRQALERLRHTDGAVSAAPPGGVLLISLDAVRADHLSVYGYPHQTSPALARLAGHATVYRNVLAASDMSLGTHASLFTGKYPSRHGASVGGDFSVGRPLTGDQQTMAERLAGAGYARIGVAANGYFLNSAYGLTRGFNFFDVQPRDRLEFRFRLESLFGRLTGTSPPVHRPAAEINAVLRRTVRVAFEGGRGFLAFVNYMEAHSPYTPDEAFEKRFPGYDPALPRGERVIGAEGTRTVFDAGQRRHLVSQYDAGIASIDHQLGLLFDELREGGLYDKLLIIVVADHGEMLGERGVFGHGAGLSEEVLRVPLIVKYPHQAAGRSVNVPVSQVDVLPTVLDVLGLPPDPSLDGTSLRRVEALPPRALLAESPPAVAVYDGSLKLLLSADGRRSLFDLARDPGEERELSETHPGAAELQRVLDSWRARRAVEPALSPDPATRDRLKSLGYVR